MLIKLHNADVETIIVKYSGKLIILQPADVKDVIADSEVIEIELIHVKKNTFNSFWYILTELFENVQMRTVLMVDGKYTIRLRQEASVLKIKSYEYVFEKNTSYHTFIFASDGCEIIRKSLEIPNKEQINKKAGFLYLIGGAKTFFPLTGVASAVLLINLFYGGRHILLTAGMLLWFFICFYKYIKSLSALKNICRKRAS